MKDLKLAVIYYSMSGTNYQLAQWAADSAKELGAEVRLLKVQEVAPTEVVANNEVWAKHTEETKHIPIASSEDIEWADAIIFSIPTRFGNMPSQIKQFIDIQGGIWSTGGTVNKVVSAMSSSQNPNGGQEAAILSLYTSMMHWGAIIAAPGYTSPAQGRAGGNPYGTSVTVDSNGEMIEDVQEAVKHQAKRTLEIAKAIKTI